jgi:hypothetical protein
VSLFGLGRRNAPTPAEWASTIVGEVLSQDFGDKPPPGVDDPVTVAKYRRQAHVFKGAAIIYALATDGNSPGNCRRVEVELRSLGSVDKMVDV